MSVYQLQLYNVAMGKLFEQISLAVREDRHRWLARRRTL